MIDADDDSDFLHLYRVQAWDLPSAALDARILAASRTVGVWRRLIVLLPAAAAAACLMLALQPVRHVPQPQARATAASTALAGLHDGQISQQLADSEMMRQTAIMQLPGGSDGGSNGS